MTIQASVEGKIRYLCAKFPNVEWSGILFYDSQGKFEDNSLEIICKDIFLMDIDSAAYTEYDINPEVARYMATNNLMEYKQGIVH